MRFKLNLITPDHSAIIPINYQYPASAAIYRIISRADTEYATFLHEIGYKQSGKQKSFKLFTFSDIRSPFRVTGDRLHLTTQLATLEISFHLPQAAENFIKGLFMHQQFELADKKSKARFEIQSVESISNTLPPSKPNELISVRLKQLSPVVAGLLNENGDYDFLSPDDRRFSESLTYNWRSKISTCYDTQTGNTATLLVEVISNQTQAKSRLVTIKAGTLQETKIRGWTNFELSVTAEKRFVELILNAGVGVYNSVGFGCVEAII